MSYDDESLWFLFNNTMPLLRAGVGSLSAVPRYGDVASFVGRGAAAHLLGEYESRPCYALALQEERPVPGGFLFTGLRDCYDILGERLYTLAGKGAELIHWDNHSKFCPACGTPTRLASSLSKKCPACGNEIFPQIAVATIVLVRNGDEALLIRGRNNPRKTHGLVAGFLEPGESLEECVTREVAEETGLAITNVAYFASQPWPYPSGLMAGFMADYAGGTIALQEEELSAAAFFSRDNLPAIPHKLSIARRLIDAWLEEGSAGSR